MVGMTPREPSTAELVRALRQAPDSEEHFTPLCRRYYPVVYGFFQRKGLSPADGWDLTQEVFLAMYQGLGGLREADKFEHWLYKIAKHKYWAHGRGRLSLERSAARAAPEWAPAALEPAARSPVDWRPTPEEQLLNLEKLARFRHAWRLLPPQMRRCMSLRASGLRYKEIATVLQIGVETVRSHLHQGRKLLKEKLSAEAGDIGGPDEE